MCLCCLLCGRPGGFVGCKWPVKLSSDAELRSRNSKLGMSESTKGKVNQGFLFRQGSAGRHLCDLIPRPTQTLAKRPQT